MNGFRNGSKHQYHQRDNTGDQTAGSPSRSGDLLQHVDLQPGRSMGRSIDWSIAKRRWQPAIGLFAISIALATLASQQQKPIYIATGKLTLKTNRVLPLTGLGSSASGDASHALRTESEKLLSTPVVQKAIDALKLKDAQGSLMQAEDLIPSLKVKEINGADVLGVTYSDGDPRKAAALINQLMQEYVKGNLVENRSEAIASKDFIIRQVPKTEAAIQQTDTALRSLQEESGIVDIDSERKLLGTGLADVEAQINRSRTELTEANTRYIALRDRLGMSPQTAIDSSALSQSVPVQQALSQWQQLQSQLRLERVKNTEEHPTIVKLKEQEVTLQKALQERVTQTVGNAAGLGSQNLNLGEVKLTLVKEYLSTDVSRSTLSDRLVTLNSARDTYRNRLMKLPRIEQQDRELRRKLATAQETYQTLLNRLQEVTLTEQQTIGTARIIELATQPKVPVAANKELILALGVLVGLLLSTVTVVALEASDRSVKSLQEARDLYGYAALGTIPWVGKSRRLRRLDWSIPELPVRDDPRSAVSSSYRMLQANLRFLNFEGGLKSLVISSAMPREGKSTIAANLAATMAQLGRKTLLIDADLHHPSQHHIWNLTNVSGLSNVIVGQDTVVNVTSNAIDNLDVITSGVIPPNPLALLDSARMAELMEQFESRYDIVIIDAPPLVVEAEALTLGTLTDGLLLVARPGILETQTAKLAREQLQQSGQSVLGLVLNSSLKNRELPNSGYYNRPDYRRPIAPKSIKSTKPLTNPPLVTAGRP
jgi:polysaccharide biosynthesis transport protein